jgi:hypothetical protein
MTKMAVAAISLVNHLKRCFDLAMPAMLDVFMAIGEVWMKTAQMHETGQKKEQTTLVGRQNSKNNVGQTMKVNVGQTTKDDLGQNTDNIGQEEGREKLHK